MLLSQENKEIMYTKPSPHLLSAVDVEISRVKTKKTTREIVKSAGGDDCE
jgi:hypothetical protein